MSNCSCIYVNITYEETETLKQKMVKARKKHKCYECGEEIKKGDKYEYYFGVYDGETCEYKTCIDCLSVRKEFFCNGWFWGDIWKHIRRHIYKMNGKISSNCLASLTKKARGKICDLIEEVWEEIEIEELLGLFPVKREND